MNAARNVASAYAEINMPFAKGLEVDIAGRYDNYEAGRQDVQPEGVDALAADRRSCCSAPPCGKGFRAPTLVDLYQPAARGITTNGQRDLVRCPIGITAIIDCSTQFVTIGGGNPALKPEKSKSQNRSASSSSRRRTTRSARTSSTCRSRTRSAPACRSRPILANPVRYADLITRGAPDGNASGAGPILGISQALTNLGKTNVSGVDINLQGRVYNTPGDKVTLRLDGTYFTRYDTQNLDGSYSNVINNPAASGLGIGVALRWRHVASAT